MYEKLADIFSAVAIKYLTAVDVKRTNSVAKGSNQHEIGGLVKAGFGECLGLPGNGEKAYFQSTMIYIRNDEDEPVVSHDTVSWYDTRFNAANRGPEYRLYYKTNDVTELAREGDFFLIALTKENTLLMVFTEGNGQVEHQLRLLFEAEAVEANKGLKEISLNESQLVLPVQMMLNQLGIDVFSPLADDYKKEELLRERFGFEFPSTLVFSEFAREQTELKSDPTTDPDNVLVKWMSSEEHLFRLLEKYIVASRLKLGFGDNGDDVDDFVKYALKVLNRRKARAGLAFEHHIRQVLQINKLDFATKAKTEGKQVPDFLFPGQEQYMDPDFDSKKLRILGAKTSCKDRWRQVLPEAERVQRKHLITLEPGISEEQTQQMDDMNLQLVVPTLIQSTYKDNQLDYLMSFKEFIDEIKKLQSH